jgi:hypothetical protein
VLTAVEMDISVVSEKLEDLYTACDTFVYATVSSLALGSFQPLVESVPELLLWVYSDRNVKLSSRLCIIQEYTFLISHPGLHGVTLS